MRCRGQSSRVCGAKSRMSFYIICIQRIFELQLQQTLLWMKGSKDKKVVRHKTNGLFLCLTWLTENVSNVT